MVDVPSAARDLDGTCLGAVVREQDRSHPVESEAPLLLVDVRTVDPAGVRMIVTGDIDAVSESALDTATFVVLRHHRPRHLSLDLAAVGFIDVSGVTSLLRCQATARSLACDLTLTNPQPAVREVLRIVGLSAHFGVAEPTDRNRRGRTNGGQRRHQTFGTSC
jgi:anti-anti-sigma factor